jgi:hypothetical protein
MNLEIHTMSSRMALEGIRQELSKRKKIGCFSLGAVLRRIHAKDTRRQRQRGGGRQRGAVGIGGRILGLQQLRARDVEVRDGSDAVAIGRKRPIEGRFGPPFKASSPEAL